MARINVPEGDGGELVQVWSLSPELGAAVGNLSAAVYGERLVSPRVREVARMRIAQINGCNVCLQWRFPEMADRGVTEALYEHVDDPEHGDYSEQERLAIEYADKFALDHRSLDDAFFARLRAAFTDAEIVELTAMIGNWLAFGRFQAVLDVAEACAWAPPRDEANDDREEVAV
jgi:alkylhydroperoxidase family enzyme